LVTVLFSRYNSC